MQESSREPIEHAERRHNPRCSPRKLIRVTRTVPVVPLADAQVLNVSASGVALRCSVPLQVGDRLSFHTQEGAPPVLGEVLACSPDPTQNGRYIVRCRCLLGGFSA